MEAIPPTGDALVASLNAQFPLRNPKPTQTHAEIMYAAGQRSVIEYLLNLQNLEKE